MINSPEFAFGKANILVKFQAGAFEDVCAQLYYKGGDMFEYGDTVYISGKLSIPEDFVDFSYKKYLASQGISAVSFNPEIHIYQKSKSLFTKLFRIKRELLLVFSKIYPYPHFYLVSGMTLGIGDNFPDAFKEDLRISGLIHMVVVSGSNLAFLLSLIYSSLAYLRVRKIKALLITIVVLLVYCVLVGFDPPVIRALIMATFSVLALFMERQYFALRSLCLTAFIMLFINPFFANSVSFQLSFAASFGLIFLSPNLIKLLHRINFRGYFAKVLATTLSAQLAVLPVSVMSFGIPSPKVLISNMLVSWLPPFVMFLGLCSGFFGYFYLPLGKLFGWFCYLCLEYLNQVIGIFS